MHVRESSQSCGRAQSYGSARPRVTRASRLARRAAAGVPALRIEQLAALAGCGLVRFIGGDPAVATEPTTVTFVLRTRTMPGEEFRAARLVDAWLPDSDAVADASGLLRRMAGDGLVRMTTPATPAHGAKLATYQKTFHALDHHGTRDDRLGALVALGDHAASGALVALSRRTRTPRSSGRTTRSSTGCAHRSRQGRGPDEERPVGCRSGLTGGTGGCSPRSFRASSRLLVTPSSA